MELDELKKSWNALDKQLQKKTVADKKQIEKLITSYKAKTQKSMGRLAIIQRFSIGMGALALLIILLVWLSLPAFGINENTQSKMTVFLLFLTASILTGMWWDWKTYCWNKATHVDNMSVAEVSRRMTVFRRWTQYEVVGISVWIVLFNVLNYWMMEYHLEPIGRQVLLISFFAIINVAIIYFLYKKLIYKHLDDIKKNIEELKDVCTE